MENKKGKVVIVKNSINDFKGENLIFKSFKTIK
jgi:hypothetical protein